MNYKLVYTRRAERDIKKLDPSIRKSNRRDIYRRF